MDRREGVPQSFGVSQQGCAVLQLARRTQRARSGVLFTFSHSIAPSLILHARPFVLLRLESDRSTWQRSLALPRCQWFVGSLSKVARHCGAGV